MSDIGRRTENRKGSSRICNPAKKCSARNSLLIARPENNRKKDANLQPQSIATAFINVHNTEGRPQPKGIVASVSRLFLAQSIECALCHNHPMAMWEQHDFWAAAAFSERVRYEKAVYGNTSIARLIEPTKAKHSFTL